MNPRAEKKKKKEQLSHPPTPPPALLPPFAADLPCQPSPSLHSFSCSLLRRLFLHLLLPHVLLLCSSHTATHYCFHLHLRRSLRCFLVTMWVASYYYKAALCITNLSLFHLLSFSAASPPRRKESSILLNLSLRGRVQTAEIQFFSPHSYLTPNRHFVTKSQQEKRGQSFRTGFKTYLQVV